MYLKTKIEKYTREGKNVINPIKLHYFLTIDIMFPPEKKEKSYLNNFPKYKTR